MPDINSPQPDPNRLDKRALENEQLPALSWRERLELESKVPIEAPEKASEREILDSLDPSYSKYRDIHRFEQAKDEIVRLSLEIGKTQDREAGHVNNAARLERRSLRNGISDLFVKYADMEPSLDKVIQAAEQHGLDTRERADRLVCEVALALRGAGVNHGGLVWLLSGKSKDDLRMIEHAFKDRYDQDLGEAIRGAYRSVLGISRAGFGTSFKLAKIERLLEGDATGAAAVDLHVALRKREGAKVFEALLANQDSIPELRARYDECYGEKMGPLDEALHKRLPTELAIPAQAIMEAQPEMACAMRLQAALAKPKPHYKQLCEALKDETPDQLRDIKQAYRRLYASEITLPEDPKKGENIYRDKPRCMLDGDTLGAQTAELRACLVKQGGWPGVCFHHKTKDERDALVADYERKHGDLWKDMRACIGGGTALELMRRLVDVGTLTRADLLRDCMCGLGTDSRGVKRLLNGLTVEQIEETAQEYKKFTRFSFLDGWKLNIKDAVYALGAAWQQCDGIRSFWSCLKANFSKPRDLYTDLKAELSGEDWLDVQVLLRGEPKTPQEMLIRMRERHRHERGGVLNKLVDLISREGKFMDRDVRLAEEFYEKHIAGKAADLKTLQKFELLVDFAEVGFDSFRHTKNRLAYMTANLVSAATSAVATGLALAASESLVPAMLATGLVSLVTRVGLKWGLTAKGYGREELGWDTTLAAIDGGTLAAGKFMRLLGPVGRRIVTSPIGQKAVKFASKFLLKRLVQSGQEMDGRKHSHHLEHSPEFGKAVDSLEGRGFDANELLRKLSLYA